MSDQTAAWPAVTYEELGWDVEPAVPASRTARRRQRGPYRAAVVAEVAVMPIVNGSL